MKSNRRSTTRRLPGLAALVVVACLSTLVVFGGAASAAPDPVSQARKALADRSAQRLAAEKRIDAARRNVAELEGQLAGVMADDKALAKEVADAKTTMREFAVAAYIDGRESELATAALDPTNTQKLILKSTLSVGQAATANDVAHHYSQLRASVSPKLADLGERLEAARQSLVDAQDDVIQAAAFERDAEASLKQVIDRVAQQEREERQARQAEAARQRDEAASTARAAARLAAVTVPKSTGGSVGSAGSGATTSPKAPAPTAPSPVQPGDTPRGNPSAHETATLAKIRRCESGGNYRIVSGSGRYRGAYQFDYRTWAGVGGSGDPAAASPAEQDYRALLLLRQRGTRPWPVCGR